MATGDVLSVRELNRATLKRQLLLERTELPALEALKHLVGMQAQAPKPPYTGLWTRLAGFTPSELSDLIASRHAVRIALMRGTVHLVTAGDCLAIRPLVQEIFDRDLATNTAYARHLNNIDIPEVVAAGRALLEEKPRTAKELGELLHPSWPASTPPALAHALRSQAPLVQVPPRGLWGASGSAAHTTAEHWLSQPLHDNPPLDELIRRYLGAFGPASVRDIQTWSGLRGLADICARMRPDLRVFRDESGTELLDLPSAPRPDPATPAPVRFLPEFDNLVLSHANRTRVVSDDDRKRLMTVNGIIPGTVLLDGFVRATWKITAQRGSTTLTITPFEPLSTSDREAVEHEGADLLTFITDSAGTQHIRFE